MADFIVLTKEQADAVRGVTTPGHALDPIGLEDGSFVLPLAVLSDPAHSMRKASLEVEQKREVIDAEWKWKAAPDPHEAREVGAIEGGAI